MNYNKLRNEFTDIVASSHYLQEAAFVSARSAEELSNKVISRLSYDVRFRARVNLTVAALLQTVNQCETEQDELHEE